MDAAMVQSGISAVKELLPDYGDGFILTCLRVRGFIARPGQGCI